MKIKFKLTLGITSILIVLGILLNISIRNVLTKNMETSLNNSLNEIMNSTREAVKYRLTIDDSVLKEELLSNQSNYLVKYISLNYECTAQINDINGTILSSNINNFTEEINKGTNLAMNGQATANIKYAKGDRKSVV